MEIWKEHWRCLRLGTRITKHLSNEDPSQGEMPKARRSSIPKDMVAVVHLHMQV